MRKLLLIAAVSLAGCSSFSNSDVAKLQALINQGRCSEAAALAGSVDHVIRFNNLGVVALDCEHNRDKARNFFEYGARAGDKMAAQNLLSNGWPVPTNDIQQANQASQAQKDAAVTNGLLLLQAAQPKFQPMQTTSCTTRNIAGTLKTDCW